MKNNDKSDIINEYSKNPEGPLVGRGNETLTRAEDIKSSKKDFTTSLETPSLEDVKDGEDYGGKEYHGI